MKVTQIIFLESKNEQTFAKKQQISTKIVQSIAKKLKKRLMFLKWSGKPGPVDIYRLLKLWYSYIGWVPVAYIVQRNSNSVLL